MPAPALPRAVLLVLGAWLASRLNELPEAGMLPAMAIVLIAAGYRWSAGRGALAWLSLGAGLFLCDLRSVLDDRLDEALAGVDVDVSVRIADFPEQGGVLRLLLAPLDRPELPRRLRVSWYDAAGLPALGECWQMTLRLRRPRGFANPGRFDYEQWLLQKRIGATGYVREGRRAPHCDDPRATGELRRRLLARIRSSLPADDRTAVLLAITLGARQWIDDDRWRAFMRTGTGHLMAISGMHVGLAAGAVFLLLRLLLGLSGMQGNHRHPAVLASLLFAGMYAALSGFAVPSRRAVLMLAAVAVASILGRRASSWQVFGLALMAVVVSAPLDALAPGFLLSFGAVALLIHFAAVHPRAPDGCAGLAAKLGRSGLALAGLQLMLLFGLLPLTAGLFGRVSLVAPLANLLVLPLFSFVALPVALAGAALPTGGGDLLLLAAWRVIGWILNIVQILAGFPVAEAGVARLGPFGLVAAGAALLATLLPPGWPLRKIRWLALALLLARPAERPPEGCLDVDVLDVGQGLSTVLRTPTFTLVYDAGPAFRSGGDTGRLVLAPFLDYLGVRRIDLLVLSHDDLDHTGGLRSLDRWPPVTAVLRGEASRRGDAAATGFQCRAGQVWFRDHVRFAVLAPAEGPPTSGNNASCVIEVSAGDASFLLTGDIESGGERSLLRADLLSPVDVVLIPHHGSKTSSHDGFVDRLSPRMAIASAGFGNRWGMPKAEVVERWTEAGARFLSTPVDGAIGIRLCSDGRVALRYRQRHDERRLWHER